MSDGLADFAKAVLERAAQAEPGHRFGRRKVFLAALDVRGGGRTLPRLLVEAHAAGLLELSRADLIPVMDGAVVAASEIAHGNACFHFVRLPDDDS